MKLHFLFAPLLALLVGCASPIAPTQPAQAAPIMLSPGVSIYLSEGEPEPVLLAAKDLARDCKTALGTESPIVRNRAQLNGQTYIEIIGLGADATARADAKADISGVEAHGVFALDNRVALQLIDALKDPKTKPIDEVLKDKRPTANSSYFNIVPAERQTRLDAFVAGTGTSIEKLTQIVARAEALMPQLPAQERTFFNDELLVRARFMLAINQAANNLALAVRDGDNKAVVNAHLRAAQAAMARMSGSLVGAQHGEFEDWYKFDYIFKMKEISDSLTTLNP